MEIVAVMKLEITGLPISNNVENPHEQLFSKPRKKILYIYYNYYMEKLS